MGLHGLGEARFAWSPIYNVDGLGVVECVELGEHVANDRIFIFDLTRCVDAIQDRQRGDVRQVIIMC